MRSWFAPFSVAALALSCSLTNDLAELEGTPDASGPGGAGGASGGAAGSGGSADSGVDFCQLTCDRQMLAQCPNSDMTSCLTFCETAGEEVSAECRPAWEALMSCAGQQGVFVCDSNGVPQLDNCTSQTDTLLACLEPGSGGAGGTGGAGGSGGAGGTGGSGGSPQCQTTLLNKTCNDFQQNVCTACLVANCCAETNGCLADLECAGLYECYSACQASPDPQSCVDQQCPACKPGEALFNVLGQCLVASCSAECGSSG